MNGLKITEEPIKTYKNRFREFDEAIFVELLKDTSHDSTRILDVAISDGSTTLGLIEQFETRHLDYELVATDLDTHYLVLKDKRKPSRRVVLNQNGETVQIIIPPFVFGHPSQTNNSKIFLINRLVLMAAKSIGKSLVERWKSGDKDIVSEKIVLFNPHFISLREQNKNISLQKWNIIEAWGGAQVNLLRAMNIMNPTYFNLKEQQQIFCNFVDALREHAILAVGSNRDAGTRVDGAIYRKINDCLHLETAFGAGNPCNDGIKKILK